MTKYQFNQNICWDCQKATGGCSWSRNFTPVEGWEAELIPYQPWKNKHINFSDTYHITKCPEFVEDEPRANYPAILTPEEDKEFMKGKVFPTAKGRNTLHE